MDNTPISLTDRAARHVRNYLAKHRSENGLRIAVKPTGCSGYKYVVEKAGLATATDTSFESHGINIVVDQESLRVLRGTELDYIREGLNEGFRFNNPNVSETCGCGESFTVQDPATN